MLIVVSSTSEYSVWDLLKLLYSGFWLVLSAYLLAFREISDMKMLLLPHKIEKNCVIGRWPKDGGNETK